MDESRDAAPAQAEAEGRRPKVMVASRVSRGGQAMSSPWRTNSRMMLVNAGHHGGEHRDAGPQPASGYTSQALQPMNASDASTSARVSRAAPGPNRTIAAAVTTQSTHISPGC